MSRQILAGEFDGLEMSRRRIRGTLQFRTLNSETIYEIQRTRPPNLRTVPLDPASRGCRSLLSINSPAFSRVTLCTLVGLARPSTSSLPPTQVRIFHLPFVQASHSWRPASLNISPFALFIIRLEYSARRRSSFTHVHQFTTRVHVTTTTGLLVSLSLARAHAPRRAR